MTHSYSITGMTCSGCVGKVKSELLKLADITVAEVQLQAPQATITMLHHVPTATLQHAISKAGNFSITDWGNHSQEMAMDEKESSSFYPLFLIFGYITGTSLLLQLASGHFILMQWMSHFMGGFFLVFSFFKLMNLRGFAEGFSTYDLLARRVPAYGFIYPFLELALGLAFISGFQLFLANAATLALMGLSSIGVIQSLLSKKNIQCACLGTVIRLPLGTVSLSEDLLMMVMSGIMIYNGLA
jgi:cation transport ATPase